MELFQNHSNEIRSNEIHIRREPPVVFSLTFVDFCPFCDLPDK